MKNGLFLAVLFGVGGGLTGCTVIPAECCGLARGGNVIAIDQRNAQVPEQRVQEVVPSNARVEFAPGKVLAVGYGAIGIHSSQLTAGQQRLMAMRAARVDAYRNLAEQVYGFRVWGNTAVSAFATQNDNVRTYVDAFIRGARVVNMTITPDGNYEATVELDLTSTFLACVSGKSAVSACAGAAVSGASEYCGMTGCVQPAAYYYSN
jgi:hypothetical protein